LPRPRPRPATSPGEDAAEKREEGPPARHRRGCPRSAPDPPPVRVGGEGGRGQRTGGTSILGGRKRERREKEREGEKGRKK